jgi:hypothetical protein
LVNVLNLSEQMIASSWEKLSIHTAGLEDKLPDRIHLSGIVPLEELLYEVADTKPYKLVKAVPALVHKLGSEIIKHKFTILGVLLSVALVVGAEPILPVMEGISVVCGATPDLFVPYFKLLAAIAGSGGGEPAVKCLILVAKVAKSGLVKSPAHQAAILDAVNIIKDHCKYSNLFQPETLNVLRRFSVHNPVVFANIDTWNSGKSAKRGNAKDFMINAGVYPAVVKAESSGSPLRWFSRKATSPAGEQRSPSFRAQYGSEDVRMGSPAAADATEAFGSPSSGNKKHGAVVPSPQSQNLALLQHQLQFQQLQLQQQMLMVQQQMYAQEVAASQQQQQQQQFYMGGQAPSGVAAGQSPERSWQAGVAPPHNTPYTAGYLAGQATAPSPYTYLSPGVFQVGMPQSPEYGTMPPSYDSAQMGMQPGTGPVAGTPQYTPVRALFPSTQEAASNPRGMDLGMGLPFRSNRVSAVEVAGGAQDSSAQAFAQQVMVTAQHGHPARETGLLEESAADELERLRQQVILLEQQLR